MKQGEQDRTRTSPSSLPRPSIAAIPEEGASSTASQRGDGSWWSQALEETRDIDDFDSLIDTIDSTPKTGQPTGPVVNLLVIAVVVSLHSRPHPFLSLLVR